MSSRPECPLCGKRAGLTGCFGDCIKQVDATCGYKIEVYSDGPCEMGATAPGGRDIDGTSAVESELDRLREALTEAHRVILHELDSGRTPYMLKVENGGKGLGYFEDVLAGVSVVD